jgi:hypothetical protein
LNPKCSSYLQCNNPDDFCIHTKHCLDSFAIKYTSLKGETNPENILLEDKLSICCCYDINEKNNVKHNINTIFSTNYFSGENINDKYNKVKIDMQKRYIPQYQKMVLFAGKNKNAYEVIKYLNSDNQYLNIYGDTIENLKMFIISLIEYYKERNEVNKKESKHIIIDEFSIQTFKDELRNNETYLFYIQAPKYIQEIKALYIKAFNLIKYKIILISEKIYNDGNNFKSIKINPEPFEPVPGSEEKKDNKKVYNPNYYIKYQHKYSVREIWKDK